MSDFLGRLAARNAESSAPAIAPRAASRFEVSPVTARHDAIEPGIPVEIRQSARIPELASTAAKQPAVPVLQPSVSPQTPRGKDTIRPSERAEPVRMRVEQILKEVETMVTSRTIVDSRREVVRDKQQLVASPVVPRIEKTFEPHAIALARSATTQARGGESEPTVIRVHIGRVEVRANPTHVERPRVRSTQRNDLPKPMTLDRYLSGKERP